MNEPSREKLRASASLALREPYYVNVFNTELLALLDALDTTERPGDGTIVNSCGCRSCPEHAEFVRLIAADLLAIPRGGEVS